MSKSFFKLPPLRGTPSINRGRVEMVVFSVRVVPPLFIEEVARSDGGEFLEDKNLLTHPLVEKIK